MSCFKKAEREEGLLIRIWNPTGEPVEAGIRPGFEYDEAVYVDFNENPLDGKTIKLKKAGRTGISFTAGPHKILSFLFRGITRERK